MSHAEPERGGRQYDLENLGGGERILKDSGGKPREQSSPPSQFLEGDLLEWAWALIANASGGDWRKESPEWKEAAVKWRDTWLKTLTSGERCQDTAEMWNVAQELVDMAYRCIFQSDGNIDDLPNRMQAHLDESRP